MTKAATAPKADQPADVTDAAFNFPESAREMAETSMTKVRESYEIYKDLSNDSAAAIETSFDAISRNASEINKTALGAVKSNINFGFDYFENLMGVKTLAEAIEMQSNFARSQFELFSSQAKNLQTMFGKATEEAVEPVKGSVTRAVETFKAAF